ncbi:MAG: hypothetical protein K1X64_14055 [Myxococcaceae bacterium]|nr:hypothetical protein [Myxococcaceae bacterium]
MPQAESLASMINVGWLTLDESGCVIDCDATASSLLYGPQAHHRSGVLLKTLVPHDSSTSEAPATFPPVPFTYAGVATHTAINLLVNVAYLPGAHAQGPLVASVTFINDYLANSHARARVQLRSTVESIVAGFAHEVRNPLAAILSLTEAAIQEVGGTPHSALVPIPGLVQRVESLIKQSLAYSRPRPPMRLLHPATFLVERATSLLRHRDTPATLHAPGADSTAPPAMVDLLHAEQILVHLIENALDAARTWVRITIGPGRTHAPSLCIEVSDDGPGVTSETAGRIFQPFFTTRAQGTGLGLAIARDLARMNGGDLRLKSASPGATFQVLLPSTLVPVRGRW